MALCSITDIETKYQRSFAAGVETDAVDAAIVAAETAVVAYLDRTVEVDAGRQEIFHVLKRDYRLFTLDRIASLTTVEESDGSGGWTALTLDDDFVMVDQDNGILHRISTPELQKSWKLGYNSTRVTYDAGWSVVPSTICDIVAEIAYAKFLFSGVQGEGDLIAGAVVSERMGDYQIEHGDVRATAGEQSLAGGGIGISKEHARRLAPYRRRYVA